MGLIFRNRNTSSPAITLRRGGKFGGWLEAMETVFHKVNDGGRSTETVGPWVTLGDVKAKEGREGMIRRLGT